MKHLTKILLIVIAIVGLAIGMSTVTGYNNSSDNVNSALFADNAVIDSNCGSGKCGGSDAKETTIETKCGGDDAGTKDWNFMDIDANGDGKVSKTEFTEYGTKEFPNKDANNDGKITSDECVMFDSFNRDENDYLSKAEFQEGHNKMFSKMDENNDGFIDANESKLMHKSASAKCGEGKSVESKCGGAEAKADVKDVKCGAGKCG